VITHTVGVEEEFLLVDADSRLPAPRAGAVLERAARACWPGHGGPRAELLATQVEAASGVCTRMDDLRGQLHDGRRVLAGAAEAEGLRLVATGSPVLAGEPPAVSGGHRFGEVAELYAGLVAGYQACGCHVHVGVPDREVAVGVLDHLRPWLPLLLAVSVNAPYAAGRDTGYASWRMVEQSRFPGAGVPPRFGSAAAYDRAVARQIDCGVVVDAAMSFWLARVSPRLPTVEVRAADTAGTVREAVLQAALTRALVGTAVDELAAGREAPYADDQVLAAAVWMAARHGMAGPAVDPIRERRVPARERLDDLLSWIRPRLEAAGDLADVASALTWQARHGDGAGRQRRAASRGLSAVVDMLAAQTVPAGHGFVRTDPR